MVALVIAMAGVLIVGLAACVVLPRIRLARMDEGARTAAVAARAIRDLRRQSDRRQKRKQQDADAAGTSWAGPGTSESAVLTWGPGLL